MARYGSDTRDKTAAENLSRLCRFGVLAAAIVSLVQSIPARAEPVRVTHVIDGDTFRLASGERIRIARIDAPETQEGQAKCGAEIARGKAATAAARTLLEGRMVTLERVGHSYNRTVAHVRLDGRDVAAMLVARGAAMRWPRGKPRPSWCGQGSRQPMLPPPERRDF